MDIKWRHLSKNDDSELRLFYDLYDAAFPIELRERHEIIEKSLIYDKNKNGNRYHLLVGKVEQSTVAFASYHYLEKTNVGFIVYVAIDANLRGGGIGSKLLKEIEQTLEEDAAAQGKRLRAIMLESERKEDAHDDKTYEDCVKRERFFNRSGYFAHKDFWYQQPALHETTSPVPLHLYSKSIGNVISENQLSEIVEDIYVQKYGVVNGLSEEKLNEALKED
ncbi:MAG: GNAT family N-acetyltransferase [Bacilli bacterium]